MPALNLLLIDDSEQDAARVSDTLSRAGYVVHMSRVHSADGLIEQLAARRFDVVVAEYALPGFRGARALSLVREHAGDLPFIFVSRAGGEDAAVQAMRLGAQDYIRKENLARLASSVGRELREAAMRRERQRESERLAHLAYHDELTDLPNRALLRDRLVQGIRAARRDGRQLSLLMLDLDGFKEINDTLGHHTGDCVLQIVAGRLRAALRESDTVARMGGDEFAIVLPGTDAAGGLLAAHKILQELEQPIVVDDRPLGIRGSIGVAAFPEHGAGEQDLLRKADLAMYVAKNDRAGAAIYSAARDGGADRRAALLTSMWQSLERGHFSLDYQPIVSLRTGQVVVLEALLRWDHPVHGRLSPAQFIQMAEHTGLITPLTIWAIRRATSDWRGRTQPPRIAVNLSPRSLRDETFAGRVHELFENGQVDPSRLALEITETVILADPDRAARTLRELQAAGVELILDDFGTGYSSLSALRRLPVSTLKIDRSFIAGLAAGEDGALVRSIVDLAHNLEMQVIAEGVESAGVSDQLRAMGCDAIQGFAVSAPAPAEIIARWMRNGVAV